MTEEAESDAELARRAASGEEYAFTVLMGRHKEALYKFARRLTGDGDQAYEVTQQTFIAAWRALSRFDGRPFDTWLRAIALNKVRDLARRAAVRRLFEGPETEARVVADARPSAEGALWRRQQLTALDLAIARLPEALKGPLVLTIFDGRSHAEAAAILGVSTKTVETRVYRAKRRLVQALEPWRSSE